MKILVVCPKQPLADCVACTLRSAGHNAVPVYSPGEARSNAHYIDFGLAVLIMAPPYCQRLGRQLQALMPSCKILLMHTEQIAGDEDKNTFYYLPVSFRRKDLLDKVGQIETQATLDFVFGPSEE